VVIIPVLDSYLEIRQIVSTMEAILGGGLTLRNFK
jgi:hypothetical protein